MCLVRSAPLGACSQDEMDWLWGTSVCTAAPPCGFDALSNLSGAAIPGGGPHAGHARHLQSIHATCSRLLLQPPRESPDRKGSNVSPALRSTHMTTWEYSGMHVLSVQPIVVLGRSSSRILRTHCALFRATVV
jgi:hypothetical protein